MNTHRTIEFKLNGRPVTAQIGNHQNLVELLQEQALFGARESCGQGLCGCCTVIVNGTAVSGCLTLAVLVSGTAFALFHVDPVHVVGVLPLGLFLSWVAQRSNTSVTIFAHVANNSIALNRPKTTASIRMARFRLEPAATAVIGRATWMSSPCLYRRS